MLHRIFRISPAFRLAVRHSSSDKAALALKAYNDAMASEIAHAEATAKLWKRLTLFGALPLIALVGYHVMTTEAEHEAHFHRPEFIPYSHLRIRNKPFPWGDGNHSIFHNHNNALPTGYED
ncbi:cytochrome c oxidase subunit 6A2, mitochondrial isoform X1 [Hydra vulgaris]|nr:cytochrome c oxidase subunit 6A2, mitochondrial [Hydra vulgaris]